MPKPPPSWWVTFRVIGEGSRGSRGSVLTILQLLQSGASSPERIAEIRMALSYAHAGENRRCPPFPGLKKAPRRGSPAPQGIC